MAKGQELLFRAMLHNPNPPGAFHRVSVVDFLFSLGSWFWLPKGDRLFVVACLFLDHDLPASCAGVEWWLTLSCGVFDSDINLGRLAVTPSNERNYWI